MKVPMTTEEPKTIKCPECNRTPVFGAEFCPYCGTRLPLEGFAARPVEKLPDPNSVDGLCAVLLSGSKPLDIPRAGRLIAKEMGRPLIDVTREMKVSRGVLARKIGAGQAGTLTKHLSELGIETIIVPEADMENYPPLMRIKSVGMSHNGMQCEAYAWDATEEMNLSWDKLIFASCGRVILQEVQEVESLDPEVKKSRIPKLQTIIRYEYVMDIFCREPWLRLRLDDNTLGYAMVELGSFIGGKSETYRTARRLLKYAPGLPVNEGVRLLAENAPDAAWELLSFEDKREFDVYNSWLLQLARYGFPLPSED